MKCGRFRTLVPVKLLRSRENQGRYGWLAAAEAFVVLRDVV